MLCFPPVRRKATSASTRSSAISWAQRKEEKGCEKEGEEGGERWKPTLEELNYRSLFSLSFSRLLWPTSRRWCSHDPTHNTDILFNPASMKFLQIKPLCWATANYMTDWPPSGSGYSVELPCFSPLPQNQHSPSPPTSVQRGATLRKSQRASFFSGDYIFHPPPPPSPNHLSIRNQGSVVCVCRGGESVAAVIS